ncbi:hypothetical protein WZ342_2489 [Enterococcus faecalis]|nr:hypothetical protein WZ342_2489 [Enterococcus faecalis]
MIFIFNLSLSSSKKPSLAINESAALYLTKSLWTLSTAAVIR